MDFKSLNINADRICEAISKIGYKPHAAIMDIIDNSIAAQATHVTIKLYIDSSKTLNNKDNITKIEIIDNGKGMSDKEINTALELGSAVVYDNNSLSKYGLGLKSAGFSLGRRIEVASKPNGNCSSLKYVDRETIKSKNSYGVCTSELDDYYKKIFNDLSTGTIIRISNICYTSKVSANKIISNLSERLGIIYYHYLDGGKLRITIQAIKDNKVITEKKPIATDILFWDEAYETFEKESYDCKKPCKVLDEEFENPLDSDGEKIRLQISIFPQDKMKSYKEFTEEEQDTIKTYMINTSNYGFFFFRNDRLIKWGEKIPGLIARDFGFRVKISFTTTHDELFDVDVSKQDLSVPEDIHAILTTLCKLPLAQARDLFKICSTKLRESDKADEEGAAYNERNENLQEDDIEDTIDLKEKKKRQRAIQKESEEKIEEVTGEESITDLDEEKSRKDEFLSGVDFKRIRYISDFKGVHLWEPCYDTNRGTYVLINKAHPFYSQTLSKLDPSTPERQALEALFHALASGHNQTVTNLPDAKLEVIQKLFRQFLTSTSNAIVNWVNQNWNLYDNEN